jgi:hypothetical protein
MSNKMGIMLDAFKRKYPQFCEGKSEQTLLVYISFIEGVRTEIEADAKQLALRMEFANAASKILENELVSGIISSHDRLKSGRNARAHVA